MKVIEKLSKEQIEKINSWAKKAEHPQKLKNIFGNSEYIAVEFDETKAREQARKVISAPWEIQNILTDGGYSIVDYYEGICIKGKQQISIGKALKKLKASEEICNRYANDPQRMASQNTSRKIIFTINPFDVACMSTFKGWTSCMEWNSSNFHYVEKDLKYGTIVAYLVNHDDMDIEKPIARIAIKQFINQTETDVVTYRPEERTYGNAPAGFLEQVQKWCLKVFSAKSNSFYDMNGALYGDSGIRNYIKIRNIGKATPEFRKKLFEHRVDAIRMFPNPSENLVIEAVTVNNNAYSNLDVKLRTNAVRLAAIKSNPYVLCHMSEAEQSEEIQMIAVSNHGSYLRNCIKPTQQVIEAAIQSDPTSICDVPNATDDLKWMALKKNAMTICRIQNPTDEMKLYAVETLPDTVRWIRQPTKEMMLLAVSKNGDLIRYFYNYDDDVKWAAIKQNVNSIYMINSPTDEMRLYALERDGNFIRHITRQTEEMKEIAIRQNPLAIQYIIKPSREMMMEALEKDSSVVAYFGNYKLFGKKMMERAIDLNPMNIQYFGRDGLPVASDDLQMRVINTNPGLIDLINRPCDQALLVSGKMTKEELDEKRLQEKRERNSYNITSKSRFHFTDPPRMWDRMLGIIYDRQVDCQDLW